MPDLWYKNAFLYAIDVDRFQDSNGDGIGDFKGLTSRVDYLADLGVTCLWLLPFFSAPNRDNGYDIKDYYSIDPAVGTLDDFIEFVHKAGERGIRVLIDLVMNHTSNQHPWFQAARRDRKSRYYQYYIWTDSPADEDMAPVFPGEERTVWTYDDVANAYYHHTFYHYQPDLNTACMEVQEEICQVLDFWMSFGISGIRVDAAPFMTMKKGLPKSKPGDPHRILRELYRLAASRKSNAVMLGEANVLPEELVQYFGDEQGDEFQLLFNFMLNNYFYLAMARGQAEPLIRVLRLLPSVHEVGQWANFLRTLDEADMGRLHPDERQEVFAAFAPDPGMQLYDRGMRRRIAPMFAGNRARMEMIYSLLFSLPGTPVMLYGDEIGIGEDLKAQGRYAVRPPMQWTSGRNAGFSTARVDKLVQRPISTGKFAYKNVNVEDQLAKPNSLLNFIKHIAHVRKTTPQFGYGTWHIQDVECPSVFAHICEWKGKAVLAAHNLGEAPCEFEMDLKHSNARSLKPLLGKITTKDLGECKYRFRIEKYGYGWFEIDHE
jgi:maltose alpha-D-glucosyltransferase/alpha-amylase